MTSISSNPPPAPVPAPAAAGVAQEPVEPAAAGTLPAAPPREYGGRKDGTEPTRFGDWEKNGRCIDF